MFAWIGGVLLGYIAGFNLPVLPSSTELMLAAVSWLCFAVISIKAKSARSFCFVYFANGFVFGCLAIAAYCSILLEQQFLVEGQKLYRVEGDITTLSSNTSSSKKLMVEPLRIDGIEVNRDWWKPTFYIRVAIYNSSTEPFKLRVGDTINMKARLSLPTSFQNRSGFDFQKWLFSKKVLATGYVKATNLLVVNSRSSPRQLTLHKLKQALSHLPSSAYIMAIVMGDKSGIGAEQYKALNHMGISHLLAISGLHIGIIYGCIWLTLRTGLSLIRVAIPPLMLTSIGLSVLWGYIYLIDFAVSATRAGLMISIWFLVRYGFMNVSNFHGLLAVAAISLMIEPFAVLGAGWWLSFSAVSAILFYLHLFPARPRVTTDIERYQQVRQNIVSFFTELCKLQLCLFVFMLPVTVNWFGGFSVSGIFNNLVAIPLFSFVVIPMLFLASVLYLLGIAQASILLELSDFILNSFLSLLQSHSLFSVWIDVPRGAFYFICLLLMVCLFYPARYKQVGLASLTFVGVTLVYQSIGLTLIPPKVYLRFMDVGQGTAVMVQQGHEAMLYDLGPIYPSGFNLTETAVNPTLVDSAIRYLDSVIISHQDSDHRGDLSKLKKLPIERLISGCRHVDQTPSSSWRWRQLQVEILWPRVGIETASLSENDVSCVVKLTVLRSNTRVLLPGDISARIEKTLIELAEQNLIDLRADVLMSSHHGSKYSSSLEFLRSVNPKLVVHTAGVNNRFGFPTVEVTQRVNQIGARQISTSELGEITLSLSEPNHWQASYQLGLLTPFWKRKSPYSTTDPIR